MAYINEDLYDCDFCGKEITWDGKDDVHGEMWGCEECGNTFCSKCLKDAVGESGYWKIMRESDKVLCPVCAKKQLAEDKNEK